MNIEDLIYLLYLKCKLNRYDYVLIQSFVNQNLLGNGFTEKQSNLAIKILKRYSNTLNNTIQADISQFLENPTFKLPIRKSNNQKKLSIIDHSIYKKAIKVEFPFLQEKIETIRKNKPYLGHAVWDNDQRAWIFSLDERNIKFLSSFIENEDYDIDEELQHYFFQTSEILKNIENYVPMVILEQNLPKYQNVSKNVPQLQSTDIVAAVFEARKSGIFTWSDDVSKEFDRRDIDSVVKDFLNNENPDFFEINSQEHPVQCLTDIVKYTQPTLFIIPGGSELEKTKLIYNFLTELKYNSDEMSVMFRLSNKDGKEFNEFVKNCGLNNPINEQTKFVFISVKLPKPVITSNLKFHSVISLGRSNVHYTVREYFKNRQNLIYYCEPNKQREFNFDNM